MPRFLLFLQRVAGYLQVNAAVPGPSRCHMSHICHECPCRVAAIAQLPRQESLTRFPIAKCLFTEAVDCWHASYYRLR
jgi:hypothetical protein